VKLLFLTEDEDGASTRYRVRQFLPALESAGAEAVVHALPPRGSERRRAIGDARAYDAVVLQRRLLACPDTVALRRAARRLVFDFDDAIDRPDSTSGRRRSLTRRLKFRAIVRAADAVVAGSAVLARRAVARGAAESRVRVIPTVVDPARYAPRGGVDPSASGVAGSADVAGAAGCGPPTVVWIGSPSTRPFLLDVVPELDRMAIARREGVRLRVIGAEAPRARRLDCESIPWSSATEVACLASATVGIAPLRDDPWCRGKCGLRLLQYFASGVAAVASDVGAQSEIGADGAAVLAADPAALADGVRALLDDPERRACLARVAARRLRRRYSIEAWAPRWIETVTGAVERGAA